MHIDPVSVGAGLPGRGGQGPVADLDQRVEPGDVGVAGVEQRVLRLTERGVDQRTGVDLRIHPHPEPVPVVAATHRAGCGCGRVRLLSGLLTTVIRTAISTGGSAFGVVGVGPVVAINAVGVRGVGGVGEGGAGQGCGAAAER